jgi:hypothetical protein
VRGAESICVWADLTCLADDLNSNDLPSKSRWPGATTNMVNTFQECHWSATHSAHHQIIESCKCRVTIEGRGLSQHTFMSPVLLAVIYVGVAVKWPHPLCAQI